MPEAQPQLAAEYIDLAEQHLPDVWHVAQWLADDHSAAEGLVRDTLLAGLHRYGDLQGETEIRSWFLKLMCEVYRTGSNGGVTRSGEAPTVGIASDDGLERALRALPAWLRIPVLLSDVAGLSYGQIAQVLGVPVGAVRERIAKGRFQLAPHLESSVPGLSSGS